MGKTRLSTGHEVEVVSEEWEDRVAKDLNSYNHKFIRILPDGWLYPGPSTKFLDKIQNFQFRADDVVVMTFPKSGTTWMQEILWTMINNPNLDNPQQDELLWDRSTEISMDMMLDSKTFKELNMNSIIESFRRKCPGKREEDGICLQIIEAQPGRRVIKCHYPLDLMPPDLLEKTKVVYVARNPKDVVVSFYHFVRVIKGYDYQGSFEKFVMEVMNNDMFYGPYWPHVKQAWQKRNHPNMRFIFYEDLKSDFMAELGKLNDLLGTNLTQPQMKNVAQNSTFSSMKSRGEPAKGIFIKERQEKSGGFLRKGTTGDWKNHFSADLNNEMDKWIQDNVGDSGITFTWGD